MYYVIESFKLNNMIIRSIIDTFFDNLLVKISSSLITIKLYLSKNSSRGLTPINLSYIRFYFELYTLKLFINTVLFVMILFQLISSLALLFFAYAPRYVYPRPII